MEYLLEVINTHPNLLLLSLQCSYFSFFFPVLQTFITHLSICYPFTYPSTHSSIIYQPTHASTHQHIWLFTLSSIHHHPPIYLHLPILLLSVTHSSVYPSLLSTNSLNSSPIVTSTHSLFIYTLIHLSIDSSLFIHCHPSIVHLHIYLATIHPLISPLSVIHLSIHLSRYLSVYLSSIKLSIHPSCTPLFRLLFLFSSCYSTCQSTSFIFSPPFSLLQLSPVYLAAMTRSNGMDDKATGLGVTACHQLKIDQDQSRC